MTTCCTSTAGSSGTMHAHEPAGILSPSKSEAYFGNRTISTLRSVRSELEQHDPRMYALLKKLWGGNGAAQK